MNVLWWHQYIPVLEVVVVQYVTLYLLSEVLFSSAPMDLDYDFSFILPFSFPDSKLGPVPSKCLLEALK